MLYDVTNILSDHRSVGNDIDCRTYPSDTDQQASNQRRDYDPVSYTHLTLPTKDGV